jgi:signal transduction histidine kinase
MHERANLAGGHLEIVSAPGKGTRVSFEVPQAGTKII